MLYKLQNEIMTLQMKDNFNYEIFTKKPPKKTSL